LGRKRKEEMVLWKDEKGEREEGTRN